MTGAYLGQFTIQQLLQWRRGFCAGLGKGPQKAVLGVGQLGHVNGVFVAGEPGAGVDVHTLQRTEQGSTTSRFLVLRGGGQGQSLDQLLLGPGQFAEQAADDAGAAGAVVVP